MKVFLYTILMLPVAVIVYGIAQVIVHRMGGPAPDVDMLVRMFIVTAVVAAPLSLLMGLKDK